jgi:hypothetical protein
MPPRNAMELPPWRLAVARSGTRDLETFYGI